MPTCGSAAPPSPAHVASTGPSSDTSSPRRSADFTWIREFLNARVADNIARFVWLAACEAGPAPDRGAPLGHLHQPRVVSRPGPGRTVKRAALLASGGVDRAVLAADPARAA